MTPSMYIGCHGYTLTWKQWACQLYMDSNITFDPDINIINENVKFGNDVVTQYKLRFKFNNCLSVGMVID